VIQRYEFFSLDNSAEPQPLTKKGETFSTFFLHSVFLHRMFAEKFNTKNNIMIYQVFKFGYLGSHTLHIRKAFADQGSAVAAITAQLREKYPDYKKGSLDWRIEDEKTEWYMMYRPANKRATETYVILGLPIESMNP
jgi:hypothetical protein